MACPWKIQSVYTDHTLLEHDTENHSENSNHTEKRLKPHSTKDNHTTENFFLITLKLILSADVIQECYSLI